MFLASVDEMVFIVPSCNTDQGVQHMCEYRVVKIPCAMKVTVVGFLHHPPATSLRALGLSVSMSVGTRKVVNYS